MPLLDPDRLTARLPRPWAGWLRDWDRTLRSRNHPETTRYNYLLAAFQGWMIQTRSACTAPKLDAELVTRVFVVGSDCATVLVDHATEDLPPSDRGIDWDDDRRVVAVG